MFQSWGMALNSAYYGVGPVFFQFLLRFLFSIIIFVAGWAAGVLVGRFIEKLLHTVKIDHFMRQIGFEDALKRGGFNVNFGALIGGIVKWFIIVLFLIAAFDVLGLQTVTIFLQSIVVQYLPQVIIAALILLVAAVIADVLQKIVIGAAAAAHIKQARALGRITKWAVLVFAILAALVQLGIAQSLVETLFMGVVVALSLAFGLSFGLGGKETAGQIVAKIARDFGHGNGN